MSAPRKRDDLGKIAEFEQPLAALRAEGGAMAAGEGRVAAGRNMNANGGPTEIQRVTEVLDAIRCLPQTLPDPTILEIAGYPHHENVSSNILKFFFDPVGRHGLGPLCLDALFATLGITESVAAATVEREVRTDAGNRLDLVIETNAHLIGIENKIFHVEENPFEDYATFLKKRASGSKKVILVLLALRPRPDPGSEFRRILYRPFIKEARSRLAPGQGNGKYRVLFDEFLSTLENLAGGTIMEPGWTDLFETRRSDLEVLLKHTSDFKEKLAERVKALRKCVEINEYSNVKQWNWCAKHLLHDVLVHDITCADGLTVAVDAVASPKGWALELLVMTDFQKRTLSLVGMPRLRERLAALAIPYEDAPTTTTELGKGQERCIYKQRFGFGEGVTVIAEHLKAIIDKLATKTA